MVVEEKQELSEDEYVDEEEVISSSHIQLRNRFIQELDPSAVGSVYEPEDVDRIRNDDDYCQKFILHTKGDFEAAYAMVKESLAWRKTFGVKNCTQDSIPVDFFEARAAFPYNTDKGGLPIILLLIRFHKKNSEYARDMRRFVIFWVEKMLADSGGKQMTVIMNCLNAGLSNLDLDLIKFLITLFRSYYPHSLARILVYEMPWILNATWRIIKTWLPEDFVDKIIFVDRTSVLEFIDKENLHTEMGGTSTLEYVPPILEKDQNSNMVANGNDTDPKRDILSETQSGKRKVVDKNHVLMTDDYCVLAGILKIRPPVYLTFHTENAKEENTEASIKLANCSSKSITFKVKTNNIDSYRVKPSIGIIEPNEIIDVTVQLQGRPQPTDKFLIMTMKMPTSSPSYPSLSNLWKNTANENIADHKLRCVIATPEAGNVSDKIEDALKTVNSSLAQLHAEVQRIETNQQSIVKHQRITLSLMVLWGLTYSVPYIWTRCYQLFEAYTQNDM